MACLAMCAVDDIKQLLADNALNSRRPRRSAGHRRRIARRTVELRMASPFGASLQS
jgi:hypothetical protein